MVSMRFSDWMIREEPASIRGLGKGSRRAAWEYGSKAVFGCRDWGSIYRRQDCVEAERAGREAALKCIERGEEVILCPCCDQPFPVFTKKEMCR